MSQLHDLQFHIDQAIFTEVLACIPRAWKNAKLEASSRDTSGNGSSVAIRIDAMKQPGIALVSDPLQSQVRELFLLNKRFKTGLRRIVYTYSQQPDGRWSFVADYEYA